MKSGTMLLGVLLASAAAADVVHLNSGDSLDGTVKRTSGGWTVTEASGLSRFVPDSQVKSIQKTSTLSPQELAEAKVNGLRKQMDAIGDPAVAIERYERFIEQNKDTPAAGLAGKELEIWKERKLKGMSKVGGKWLTPEEVARQMGKTVPLVDQARGLIKQGRLRDAENVLNQVLVLDQENPSAVYLKGIIAYKQDQLGVAKKNFEQVREVLPEHGPTLNNLAVIFFQQKQYAGAMALYDQAMNASPRNRQILDNVIEALHAAPDEIRGSVVGKRVEKKLIDQDTELQKQMEAEGLYRWGSSYLTKEKMAEVKREQEAIEGKIGQLKADYEKLTDRVRSIDNQVQANDTTMRRMSIDRSTYDPFTGSMVITPMGSAYYQMKRDNERLKLERQDLVAKLDGFREKAERVRAEAPVPEFTGRQKLIEGEGTPLVVAARGGAAG